MNFFAWYWSFCIVSGVLYAALIIWFLNGWKNITKFKRERQSYNTKVSIVIPFYNEAKNLKRCITGIVNQNIQTTDVEIILVDDYSSDGSVEIAKQFAEKYRRVNFLQNDEKGKKQALLLGIKHCNGELVVTTDADCNHPEFWLANLVEYFELHKPNMIIGPVLLETDNSVFQKFQEIEFKSLIATGAGAIGINHPIMCNGANLAFKKSVFKELKDPLNLQYTSGDDVFLLHSMKKVDSDGVHFIKSKEAIVTTRSKKTLKEFFDQRFRWVSKAPGYSDGDTRFTAVVVFATSFLWIIGLGLLVFDLSYWKPAIFLFVFKTLVDLFFLNKISDFFGTNKLLKLIPLFQLFYGFYVVVSGLSVIFIKKRQ